MRTVFIDTHFVIAVGNERDQHHKRAMELTESCAGSRFVITEPVILEIGNALARQARAYAIEKIDQFRESDDVQLIRLTPALFDEGYAVYKTHRDKEWGLVDCISFVVMRQAGIEEALTFDQHFVQAGFRALMRE